MKEKDCSDLWKLSLERKHVLHKENVESKYNNRKNNLHCDKFAKVLKSDENIM